MPPRWRPLPLRTLCLLVNDRGWQWVRGPRGTTHLRDPKGRLYDFQARPGALQIRPALSAYLAELVSR